MQVRPALPTTRAGFFYDVYLLSGKTMALPESITINKTVYSTAKLSDASRSQIVNIQVVDAEIARLNQLLAIAQTARNAYSNALIELVKTKPEAKPEAKPRKAAAPRAKKAA
jgi:hypothetical protein